MSEQTLQAMHHLIRKTAHAVEYAILGVLIWRVVNSIGRLGALSGWRRFRLALLFAAFYAATDETHQKFVPTREPQVRDVLLDTCGATAGLTFAWWVTRRRETK